jgi:hypothetical protein
MKTGTAVLICIAAALVGASTASAGDDGSGTYIVTGQTYDFNLLNTGTTAWQYFELVGPSGTTFVGGATIGEITARCLAGQPDGGTNEIECGPISSAGLAPGTRIGFVATMSATPACGAPFQLEVSSTGTLPYTPAATATFAGSCTAPPRGVVTPAVINPPALRGTPVVGARLTAASPVWNTTPTQVVYQWQLCAATRCLPIKSRTSLALSLTSADAGHTVRIVATATFGSGKLGSDSKQLRVRAR